MTADTRAELSVILPAYNEGRAVAAAIEAYARVLPGCCSSYEMIVIDDGSTDDTYAVAREASRDRPWVRVLRNPVNQGQVATLRRGFHEARGALVTHNAVDLPFDPTETGRLLGPFRDGCDVLVVERTGREAYPVVRKVISWCNLLLVRCVLGSPFNDLNFVQVYRKELLDSLPVESRGVSTVTTELVLKARLLGFRVRRTPAQYHPRRTGRSSITLCKVVRTTRELFKLSWVLWRVRQARRAGAAALPGRSGVTGTRCELGAERQP
jgi:glycosyltransferase involved in cell wall biosynthesis